GLAIDNYSRAIQLDPNQVHNYVERGKTYRSIGRDDLAAVDERQANALEPDYAGPEEVEATHARGAAPRKPVPTDAAVAALRRLGEDERVGADLAVVALDEGIDVKLRVSAVEGLGRLQCTPQLAAICADSAAHDTIRAQAAAEWVGLEPSE